ncbi:thioredoxin family protein [Hymenobacter ginsengisoli]|uniref:Thioredoxin family protein n=1 Tax=Hymenobacter ginsengisoli TaxID=1051626 RepID=A0ABP8QL41_9BACT
MPVVVELFTSEGCSSCPSADATLRELESSQPVAGAEVIALGQHVDYWNRLGWKDQFSDPTYTARQRQYAARFGSGSYTPQAVVQGREELVGSRRADLLAAIGRAARAPQASVRVAGGLGDQPLRVRVASLPAGTGPAQVLLFITESGLATQVSGGENAGALLRHATVVRSLQPLGTVAPGGTFEASPTPALAAGWNHAHLRAVVVVQAERTRQVVGAAVQPLGGELARQ